MKKIYWLVSLLIVLTLITVACSTGASQPKQLEEDVVENEELPEKETDAAEKMDEDIYSKRLIDIMNSDEYTMKMKTKTNVEGKDLEVMMTTVVSGDQSAHIMESEDIKMTTITKGEKSYIIMHDEKMILATSTPEETEDLDLEIDEIDFENLEYVGKGKAMFLGNEREYEEYKVEDGYIRYYFDGKDLDGMEMKLEEITTTMDIEFLEKEVDKSVFEMPEDYTLIEN